MSVTERPSIDPSSIVHPGEEVVWALQEDEIAWCAGHPNVPQARRVARLHDLIRRGKLADNDQDFVAAIVALRKIRPPQIQRIAALYLYAFYDPSKRQERLVVDQPSYDLTHARSQLHHYREIQKKIPHTLSLKRFRYDRAVPFEKIRYLCSLNESTRRCEEVFAFIGIAPGGPGDEMVLGSFSMKTMQPTIYLHANAENIKDMQSDVEGFTKRGHAIELRRFVRDGDVTDLEFVLREGGRA